MAGLSDAMRVADMYSCFSSCLKRFEKCGTLERRRGSGRPSKITDEVKRIVEAQMQLDDETTTVQLRALLAQKGAYYLD